MTVVCVCVCVCCTMLFLCMWLGGSVDLFAGWSSLHSIEDKEPLRIAISLQNRGCKS